MRLPNRAMLLSLIFGLLIFIAGPAASHPNLNHFIDTSTTIEFKSDGIKIYYSSVLSELNSFPEIAVADLDNNLSLDAFESNTYSSNKCKEFEKAISIKASGFDLEFNLIKSKARIDLSTSQLGILWIDCEFLSDTILYGVNSIEWQDLNFDIPGYRELMVRPSKNITTDSDYPLNSPTKTLTDYSTLPEFLRDTEASFLVFYPEESEVEIKPKPEATQDANDELEPEPIETQPPRVIGEDPIPNPTQLQSTDSSQSLDQRLVSSWSTKLFRVSELNFSIASLGFLLAIFLGALHSFAPGHGKSMMLALSVDKALKRAQLFRLAFNMGASHTVGVLTLGAVIYFGFSQSSDLIISVLAIVLGIFLIGLGAYILRSRVHELKHHNHSHEHSHDHGHDHHHHFGFSNTRLRVFGLLGGMLPTPSALAILVGSAALGNIWYGVLLVVGYGIGMAGVLMTTGYVVQRIFLSIENQRSRSKLLLKLANYFPIGAAIIQIFAGLFLLITSIRLLP